MNKKKFEHIIGVYIALWVVAAFLLLAFTSEADAFIWSLAAMVFSLILIAFSIWLVETCAGERKRQKIEEEIFTKTYKGGDLEAVSERLYEIKQLKEQWEEEGRPLCDDKGIPWTLWEWSEYIDRRLERFQKMAETHNWLNQPPLEPDRPVLLDEDQKTNKNNK